MSSKMNKEKLEEIAKELAKDLKAEGDLAELSRELVKLTVETALKTELTDHPGCEKHREEVHNSGNNRNGYSKKKLW